MHRLILSFIFSFILGLSQQLFAQDNYQQWVFDITNRLNNTEQLIKENKIDDAKTEVQMAYFEVFENLEGPIRINFSAQKSYQMEATFGEIRKMIGEGKPMSEIQAKIEGLKKELQEVLPSLIEGHQLNADGQHGVYDNAEIKPYWQQSFKTIDDLVAQAITYYENGDFSNAKKTFQQAQYDGYKNSEMEMSVRTNRSSEISSAINQQFYNLIRLSEQSDQMTEIAYQSTQLLQDIEEQLPNYRLHEKNKTCKRCNLMRKLQMIMPIKIGQKSVQTSINAFNKRLYYISKAMRKKRCFRCKIPTLTCSKIQEWRTKSARVIAISKPNSKAILPA